MTKCSFIIIFLIKDHWIKLKEQLDKDGWSIEPASKEWENGMKYWGNFPSSCAVAVNLTHAKMYEINDVLDHIEKIIIKFNLKYYFKFCAAAIYNGRMSVSNFELPSKSHKPKAIGIIPEYLKVVK